MFICMKDLLTKAWTLCVKYKKKFETDYNRLVTNINASELEQAMLDKILKLTDAYKTGFYNLVSGFEKIGLNENLGHQGTLRNDDHSGAHCLYFFKNVCGNNNRFFPAQAFNQPPYLFFLIRVKPIGRFIKEKYRRIMDNRRCKTQPAPVPF